MKKQILLIFLLSTCTLFSSSDIKKDSNNIWLKTYKNYKNYNSIITNITKTETKLKNPKNSTQVQEDLNKKLSLYKSKLALYEKNNNFDSLLLKYKTELPNLSIIEYIFKNKMNEINKKILKFNNEKNQFYMAKSILVNEYETIKNKSKNIKINSLKSDIDYFNEYTENIEKTYQNLLEQKNELEKRYEEYKNEVFMKHILTLVIIFILYLIYKILSYVLLSLSKTENTERNKNYTKLLTLLFGTSIFIFVIIRYIDDLIYIITFLGVIAAALTIAMKEVLLNIAGAIYIFFTSIIKVGDRVMVQFETKHTIGDIVNISLIKIKLNEIDDYSNIKEIKNAGRTIYIPNSYIFTKVFYNYSLKKNSIINDIIEFEFDVNNDFEKIENIINNEFTQLNIKNKISFSLNTTKTAIQCNISYEVNFKQVSKIRGILSINLLSIFNKDNTIKLKTSNKKAVKEEED